MNNKDTADQVLVRLSEKFASKDSRLRFLGHHLDLNTNRSWYVNVARKLELTPKEIATIIIFYAIKRNHGKRFDVIKSLSEAKTISRTEVFRKVWEWLLYRGKRYSQVKLYRRYCDLDRWTKIYACSAVKYQTGITTEGVAKLLSPNDRHYDMSVAVWMGEVSCFCTRSNRPETSNKITSSSQRTDLSSEHAAITDVTPILEVLYIEEDSPTVKGLSGGDNLKNNCGEVKTTNLTGQTDLRLSRICQIEAECKASGVLWEDPEFPKDSVTVDDVLWKRPLEITNQAQVYVDGYRLTDVHQGYLGNCWFVASLATLAQHKELFEKVMPPGQNFGKGYFGCFLFRFYSFGGWVEVVIDDLLPVKDGQLVYMKGDPTTEFWPCLLEKAYAKLKGGYAALDGGATSDALVDMTGGVSTIYNLEDTNGDPFSTLRLKRDIYKAFVKGEALLCCGTPNPDSLARESYLDSGLVTGHAYTVADCYMLRHPPENSGNFLLKLRNPWGRVEWTGAWSDSSSFWDRLEPEDQGRINPVLKDDGEFWIGYEEFLKHFANLTICRVGYQAFEAAADQREPWYLQEVYGKWEGKGAGGCSNYKPSFWNNPHYSFTLVGKEDDLVQIVLCQPDTRGTGKEDLYIGFDVYKILGYDKEMEELDLSCWDLHQKSSSIYTSRREVSMNCDLGAGSYVIIPTTFYPGKESRFLLRIFSEEKDLPLRRFK